MLAPGVLEIVCPTTRASHLVSHVPLARDDRTWCVGLFLASIHHVIFGLNHEHFVAPATGRRGPGRRRGLGTRARGRGSGLVIVLFLYALVSLCFNKKCVSSV
jgi:hypothetical protein